MDGRFIDYNTERLITIKNSNVENLIRLLAAREGLDLTKAVEQAVSHELARGTGAQERRLSLMRSVADRVAELPILDDRSDEDILGYDDGGLPK